ncbi:MAG: general secretion pathway protein GspB [Candidatus Thiodiazotropha sp.]
MSSILDALERASQERQPGKEDILPKMASPKESRSTPLLLLSMGLVLILIVVTIWLLLSVDEDKGGAPPQNRHAPSQVTEAPPAQVEARSDVLQQAQPEKPAENKSRLTAERIRSSSRPNQHALVSEAKLSEKAPRKERIPPGSIPQAPRQEKVLPKPTAKAPGSLEGRGTEMIDKAVPAFVATQGRSPVPETAGARQATLDKSPRRADVVAKLDSAKPDAMVPAVDSGSESEVEQQPRIPLIWEMEQGLREKLEQLKTSIHVYNEEPSQRFVIINMRRYSEGDTLGASGYRLHAIDRDGIIIDYGRGLVRLLREKY